MTREAINKLQQIIDEHRTEAFITCPKTCWCWDVEGVMLSLELSIHPAEGAEPNFRIVLDEIERWIDGRIEPTESDLKALWNQLSDAITLSEQPQPTAEGAEEMVNSTFKLNTSFVGKEDVMFYKPQIISVMQEFAALHAQKIADKMMSERYADTEADGYVFCGKCGKMKTI